eukprot:2795933-Amphidinium_carterae.1
MELFKQFDANTSGLWLYVIAFGVATVVAMLTDYIRRVSHTHTSHSSWLYGGGGNAGDWFGCWHVGLRTPPPSEIETAFHETIGHRAEVSIGPRLYEAEAQIAASAVHP